MKKLLVLLALIALPTLLFAVTVKQANPAISQKSMAKPSSIVNTSNMVTMVIQSREKVIGGNTYLLVEYDNRPWYLKEWSQKLNKTLKYDFFPPEPGKATFTCALLLENHQFSSKKSFDLKGKTFIIVDADNKKIEIKP